MIGRLKTMPRALLLAAGTLSLFGLWQLGGAGFIHAKALVAQELTKAAWEETLERGGQVKPWHWADTYPVARLRVPSQKIDQIVLSGASGRVLAFGPGHLDGTALPGEAGLSLVSGHRDTHFTFLKDLMPGEALALQDRDGDWVQYRVTATQVVDSRSARLGAPAGGRHLALVTCYPFDSVQVGGPLRYVVFAEALQDAAANPEDSS